MRLRTRHGGVVGGSVERRLRFLREVTEAVVGAWSASRTGVRLSPVGSFNDMRDSDPAATFGAAARLLRELGVGYLHAVEGLEGSFMHVPHPERISPIMRKAFSAGAAAGAGTFVVNGGYTAERAARALVEDEADLVAFGVPFLANPDLVRRVREGAALNTPDFATFYTPGAKGYTDYPALAKR